MTVDRGVRGIEHVGITVPDIEAATAFFVSAFAAIPLFDLVEPQDDDRAGAEVAAAWDLEGMLGTPRGAWTRAIRLLRLGNGANIELFEFRGTRQRSPALPSDVGLQHVAISVADLDGTLARVVAAGGTLCTGPHELPGPESGRGNRFRYTRAPWGTTIEIVATPSPQAYEGRTPVRRWQPTFPERSSAMASEPITVVAQFSLKPGTEEQFLDAVREHLPYTMQDPGFERFWVFRDPDDTSRVLFYEEWTNRASFDASMKAAWRDSYMAATQHLWGEERIVGVWEPVRIRYDREP